MSYILTKNIGYRLKSNLILSGNRYCGLLNFDFGIFEDLSCAFLPQEALKAI